MLPVTLIMMTKLANTNLQWLFHKGWTIISMGWRREIMISLVSGRQRPQHPSCISNESTLLPCSRSISLSCMSTQHCFLSLIPVLFSQCYSSYLFTQDFSFTCLFNTGLHEDRPESASHPAPRPKFRIVPSSLFVT
jgi:hypothetical protein